MFSMPKRVPGHRKLMWAEWHHPPLQYLKGTETKENHQIKNLLRKKQVFFKINTDYTNNTDFLFCIIL